MIQSAPALPDTLPAEWRATLAAAGAVFDDYGRVDRFGDIRDEVRAAAEGTVVADLSPLSLLRAEGADAQAFLQGQFSNDIREVSESHSQLSAYCSPKGRMLAVFRIFQRGSAYYLQLPAAIAEPTARRLRMFVLRAKVKLDPADNELLRIGVSGPQAEALVAAAAGGVPPTVDAGLTQDGVTVLRLPGPHPRFELLAPPARMQELWKSIAAAARPVGAHAWAWLDIAAGVPTVLPETVEEFVPQMANLELVGGVSFKKGCYPGQEIVARMHYLGTLKQRMVRAHLADANCPAPGTKLYASEFGEQSAGTVVDAQPSPHGGCDLLAVAQLTAVQGGGLRVAALNGPVLELSPLPYSLGAAS